MSEFTDQLAADIDAVFLNPDEFGEVVTHHPQGGEGVPVTANWSPEGASGDTEGNDRRGILQVKASVAVTQRDYWLINGEEWATNSWDAICSGMRKVHLSRTDLNRRTKRQGK